VVNCSSFSMISKLVITTLSEIAFVALRDAPIAFFTFDFRALEIFFLLQYVFHLNRIENGNNIAHQSSSSKLLRFLFTPRTIHFCPKI
jgi:hypothetical protein